MSELWISMSCEGPAAARHGSRLIDRASRVDGAWYLYLHGWSGDARLGKRDGGGAVRTKHGWRFKCPRCAQTVGLTLRAFTTVLDTLETNGMDRIDLNTLNTLARNGSVQ